MGRVVTVTQGMAPTNRVVHRGVLRAVHKGVLEGKFLMSMALLVHRGVVARINVTPEMPGIVKIDQNRVLKVPEQRNLVI
jgi:hypothetical protein